MTVTPSCTYSLCGDGHVLEVGGADRRGNRRCLSSTVARDRGPAPSGCCRGSADARQARSQSCVCRRRARVDAWPVALRAGLVRGRMPATDAAGAPGRGTSLCRRGAVRHGGTGRQRLGDRPGARQSTLREPDRRRDRHDADRGLPDGVRRLSPHSGTMGAACRRRRRAPRPRVNARAPQRPRRHLEGGDQLRGAVGRSRRRSQPGDLRSLRRGRVPHRLGGDRRPIR